MQIRSGLLFSAVIEADSPICLVVEIAGTGGGQGVGEGGGFKWLQLCGHGAPRLGHVNRRLSWICTCKPGLEGPLRILVPASTPTLLFAPSPFGYLFISKHLFKRLE